MPKGTQGGTEQGCWPQVTSPKSWELICKNVDLCLCTSARALRVHSSAPSTRPPSVCFPPRRVPAPGPGGGGDPPRRPRVEARPPGGAASPRPRPRAAPRGHEAVTAQPRGPCAPGAPRRAAPQRAQVCGPPELRVLLRGRARLPPARRRDHAAPERRPFLSRQRRARAPRTREGARRSEVTQRPARLRGACWGRDRPAPDPPGPCHAPRARRPPRPALT